MSELVQYEELSKAQTIPFELPFDEIGTVGAGNLKILALEEIGVADIRPVLVLNENDSKRFVGTGGSGLSAAPK